MTRKCLQVINIVEKWQWDRPLDVKARLPQKEVDMMKSGNFHQPFVKCSSFAL
jgi:mRNA-degrading endonuclease HigB of HigAB toxin-antitoxin module